MTYGNCLSKSGPKNCPVSKLLRIGSAVWLVGSHVESLSHGLCVALRRSSIRSSPLRFSRTWRCFYDDWSIEKSYGGWHWWLRIQVWLVSDYMSSLPPNDTAKWYIGWYHQKPRYQRSVYKSKERQISMPSNSHWWPSSDKWFHVEIPGPLAHWSRGYHALYRWAESEFCNISMDVRKLHRKRSNHSIIDMLQVPMPTLLWASFMRILVRVPDTL